MVEASTATFSLRRLLMPAVVSIGLCLGAGSLLAADIDPEADRILKSMSTYLGGLNSFSVTADVDNEIIDTTGRKLQLSSSVEVVAERPAMFYAHRRGPVADVELIHDGKVLTVHGKGLNFYAQKEGADSIDGMIGRIRAESGFDVPGSDLFFADPYTGLMDGVESAVYMGTGFVNGAECHHLAFRQSKVDWQIWVQKGDTPLPMKYVITSKWVTGAPQYSARMREWNTAPEIAAGQFAFVPPEGAKRLDSIPVDEMGELMLEGEQ